MSARWPTRENGRGRRAVAGILSRAQDCPLFPAWGRATTCSLSPATPESDDERILIASSATVSLKRTIRIVDQAAVVLNADVYKNGHLFSVQPPTTRTSQGSSNKSLPELSLGGGLNGRRQARLLYQVHLEKSLRDPPLIAIRVANVYPLWLSS